MDEYARIRTALAGEGFSGPMPERQSEVRVALHELDGEIGRMFAGLQDLHERLKPVLRGDPLEASGRDRGQVRQAWVTPLARELGELADRLGAQNGYLRRLMEAVEL
jgi:hypothetical protein